MKRTSKTEFAANTESALLVPVTTGVVEIPTRPVPRLREENRQTSLHSLPDELMRQIGKFLTLREWIALRQLCKACAGQVDRQPPFILLDHDVQTDELFRQFLKDATPEYAFRLGNLIAELNMERVTGHDKLDILLEAIGKAQAWEVIKIDDRNCKLTHQSRLAGYCRPLLRGLNAGPGNVKRKLEYLNRLAKKDRAIAEEVQRSSGLQLTILQTAEVSEFLQIIAGGSEFSSLDLDLKNNAALTRETFKALQNMQGSVKCMTLRRVGSCDSNNILAAMNNKGLESLALFDSGSDNGIDLHPWLATPLRCLSLHNATTDASTFAEAIGSSMTLKTLEIHGELIPDPGDAPLRVAARTDVLSLALRMNQTLENLLIFTLEDDMAGSLVPDELLNAMLNHAAIRTLIWNSGSVKWPVLATPGKPKAMDEVSFSMVPESMVGIAYLLQQLSSLKCLRLELIEFGECNWEFLSTFSSLNLEEFVLGKYGESNNFGTPLPIAKCLRHDLRRVELDVLNDADYDGIGAALGNVTALTSLTLIGFEADRTGSRELTEGLAANKSLEEFELNTGKDEPDSKSIMVGSLLKATIVEAIFKHPNIVKAYFHFQYSVIDGAKTYIPAGYSQLLQRLDPMLDLALSGTTDTPPVGATPEEIQAVCKVYEGIAKAFHDKPQR